MDVEEEQLSLSQSVSQSARWRAAGLAAPAAPTGGQLVAGFWGEEGVKLLGGGEARGDRVRGENMLDHLLSVSRAWSAAAV